MKTLHLSEKTTKRDGRVPYPKVLGMLYCVSPTEGVRKALLKQGYHVVQINWKGWMCKKISLYRKVKV